MIDWPALGRETVELLRAYLRIDTTATRARGGRSVMSATDYHALSPSRERGARRC